MSISFHPNEKTLVLNNPGSVSSGTVIQFDKGDGSGLQNYLVVDDGSNGSYGIKDYNASTFKYGVNGNEYDMQHIITTKVTDMSQLFNLKLEFNEDIESWDTSNVTIMDQMFI